MVTQGVKLVRDATAAQPPCIKHKDASDPHVDAEPKLYTQHKSCYSDVLKILFSLIRAMGENFEMDETICFQDCRRTNEQCQSHFWLKQAAREQICAPEWTSKAIDFANDVFRREFELLSLSAMQRLLKTHRLHSAKSHSSVCISMCVEDRTAEFLDSLANFLIVFPRSFRTCDKRKPLFCVTTVAPWGSHGYDLQPGTAVKGSLVTAVLAFKDRRLFDFWLEGGNPTKSSRSNPASSPSPDCSTDGGVMPSPQQSDFPLTFSLKSVTPPPRSRPCAIKGMDGRTRALIQGKRVNMTGRRVDFSPIKPDPETLLKKEALHDLMLAMIQKLSPGWKEGDAPVQVCWNTAGLPKHLCRGQKD